MATSSVSGCQGVEMGHKRLVDDAEALPDRRLVIDLTHLIGVVAELESAQAWCQAARSRAVAGVDDGILREEPAKNLVGAAAVERITQGEGIPASQPRHLITPQRSLQGRRVCRVEVLAQIRSFFRLEP